MKLFKCHFCGQTAVADGDNFFCFSCGMGGDRVSCLRARDKITYNSAARKLHTKLLPEEDRWEEKKKVLAALADAAWFFSTRKNSAKTAYFEGRKLKKETVKNFSLGYARGGQSLYNFLLEKGVEEKVMKEAGLIYINAETGKVSDKFWNRIMFPIWDEYGRVIGFGGRVLDDEEKPKYMNSPESLVFDKSHNLYAMHMAKESLEDYFILAEGYIDVISLHQNGFTNAVASLGTAFTHGHAELIAKHKKSVCVVPDTDGPGQNAATKTVSILLKKGLDVKVASVAPYKDVDELLVAEGPDELKKRIETAITGEQFLIKEKSAKEIAAFIFANC